MNKHYLRSLPTQVLLANAGFHAKEWFNYTIPRCRGTHLSDPEVKRLVEFFFPALYDKVDRAHEAYCDHPRIDAETGRADPVSVTNFRFLANLKQLMLFWLQVGRQYESGPALGRVERVGTRSGEGREG